MVTGLVTAAGSQRWLNGKRGAQGWAESGWFGVQHPLPLSLWNPQEPSSFVPRPRRGGSPLCCPPNPFGQKAALLEWLLHFVSD